MLLVSVVMPIYNHEKYVIECLDSVRDNNYKNVELIIIDDGSIDASASLVQSWLAVNKKYFVRALFHRQTNSGVCKTLNRLISLAQGDVIIPLASDDVLLHAGISLRVNFLLNNPGYLAVFAEAAMINSDGDIICRKMGKNYYKSNPVALGNSKFIATELILRWSVPGPVFAAWKKAFDPLHGIGMYDETLLVEDRDLYLRLLSRNALGYFPDEVAMYRHVPSSLSRIKMGSKSIHTSILRSEKAACEIFVGKEKLLMKLVALKSELCLMNLQPERTKAVWFLSLLLQLTVEVVYQLHKLSVALSHLMRINNHSQITP